MKTTGVSRRIDDLGRIVIPKEIRKNFKIRDGELLEILVEGDRIILTKHSSMKSIDEIAKICIEAVNDVIDVNMIVTDRDTVVAASSQLRKKYLDKDLSVGFNELILKHNAIIQREPVQLKIDNDNEEYTAYISKPIIVDGDVAGSVVILRSTNKITEADEMLADIISKLLIRNLIG